jgi:hypothetical protein
MVFFDEAEGDPLTDPGTPFAGHEVAAVHRNIGQLEGHGSHLACVVNAHGYAKMDARVGSSLFEPGSGSHD